MAINWRREADNIIDTSDVFANFELVTDMNDILYDDETQTGEAGNGASGKQKLGNYGFVSYEFQTYCQFEQDETGKYGYRYRVLPKFRFEPMKHRLNASEIAFIQIVKAVNKIPPIRYNEREDKYIVKKVIELVQQNPAYMQRLTNFEYPIDKYWFLDRARNRVQKIKQIRTNLHI